MLTREQREEINGLCTRLLEADSADDELHAQAITMLRDLEGAAMWNAANGGFRSAARTEALALAERVITKACPHWTRRTQCTAYFDGMFGAWHQLGLISEAELLTLRKRVRDTPLPWWDVLGEFARFTSRLLDAR